MSATVDGEALRLLVAEARHGNGPAANRLVREHEGWLRSLVYGVTGRPELVDDVVQQVWTQVWERLDTLRDPQRLRPWLAAIARNAAIDAGIARRRRAQAASLACLPDVDDAGSGSPLGAVLGREAQALIMRAVSSLPAIYREPFVLRHLESWTYAQIGEALDMPVDTVETRLVRARRLLREMLSGRVD